MKPTHWHQIGPKTGVQGGEQSRAHQCWAGFLYWSPTAAPQMLVIDWESSSTTLQQCFLRERDREPLSLSLMLLHTVVVCHIKSPTSSVPVAPPRLMSLVPSVPTKPSAYLSPAHALSTSSPLGFVLSSQRESGNWLFNLSCRYSLTCSPCLLLSHNQDALWLVVHSTG